MARRTQTRRYANYAGFILSFEPGRSETLDARLRYGPHEITVGLSSKDWKLLPRELVALSFDRDEPAIDGVALMERTQTNAATATWKMRVHSPVMLDAPIQLNELPRPLRSRKLHSTSIRLSRLTESQWNQLLDHIKQLRPRQSRDLVALEAARSLDRRIFPTSDRNTRLLEERDAIGMTIDIAGMDRGRVLKSLDPSRLKQANSVLDVLDFERLHEQDVIRHDQRVFGALLRPGMRHARFRSDRGTEVRVHVYDKKALETTVGIDLLIYQELFDAFILVQYKMMMRSNDPGDRWAYRVDKQMRAQLAAMGRVAALLKGNRAKSQKLTDWRLNDEVFFWKFCEATRLKDSDGALTHGITLSREHLEGFLSLPESRSGKKAQRIGYANCHRYLTNTQFIELAREGWIGGGAHASGVIQKILEANQAGGRRAILAVIKPAESIDKRARGWRSS